MLAAAFWLEPEGYTLTATQDDVVRVTLDVVEHWLSLDDLAGWLEASSVPVRTLIDLAISHICNFVATGALL